VRVWRAAGPNEPIRCALLVEIADGAGFIQGSPTLAAWERRPVAPGSYEVRMAVGAPGLGWLVAWVLRRLTRGKGRLIRRLLPPGQFPPGSLELVATVFWAAALVAYCGTLLGQTLAFAAPTLGASPLAQGIGSGIVRLDVLVALPAARLADRIGRWRTLRLALAAAVVATAIGGLAPDLGWLVATQIVAKAGATVAVLLANVLIAEAVHAEGRAWTMGFLVLATAIGAGVCAAAVAGLGVAPEAWRALFLLAMAGLAYLWRLRGRRESARFVAARAQGVRELFAPEHRRRLALLSAAAILFNLFYLPASQFRNQFLRVDRHFAAWQVSLFTIGANLPSGIGLALGARLAETRGRRVLASLGLLLGGVLLALAYLASGPLLVGLYALGEAVGTMAVPALAVFGPELFPTRLRSGANGIVAVASRIGTVAGLVWVGLLAARGYGFGVPIASLAVGPVALAGLVWWAFPETRARSLEELNPEDGPPLAPGGLGG
jgi:MFS family permease